MASVEFKNLYLLLTNQGIREFQIYLDENCNKVLVTTQNKYEYENLNNEGFDKIIAKYFIGNNKKLTANAKIEMTEMLLTILNIESINSVIYSIIINMKHGTMSILFTDEKRFSIKFEDCEPMKIISMIINNYY